MCARYSVHAQAGWQAYLRVERQLVRRARRKVNVARRALVGITGLVALIVALRLVNWFAI